MKKATSISLSLIFLAALLNISVSTHYCQGKVAASKISLSGKHASCGMEDEYKDYPLSGTQFNSNCCDDVVVFYGINDNYTPSLSYVADSYQNNYQFLSIPAGMQVNTPDILNFLYTSAGPPRELMPTNVDIFDICVLRI